MWPSDIRRMEPDIKKGRVSGTTLVIHFSTRSSTIRLLSLNDCLPFVMIRAPRVYHEVESVQRRDDRIRQDAQRHRRLRELQARVSQVALQGQF